jgi:tryptophan-rich sensory protein
MGMPIVGKAISRQEWLWLAPFVIAVAAVMAVGGAITAPAIGEWYGGLNRPAWTPPNWLFGPVWALLYVMMAVAAWLVWQTRRSLRVGLPISVWVLQLALNLGWSFLFFGLRNPMLALIDIAVLLLAILASFVLFWPTSRLAGRLLAPYILWVGYAAALNYAIWRLN